MVKTKKVSAKKSKNNGKESSYQQYLTQHETTGMALSHQNNDRAQPNYQEIDHQANDQIEFTLENSSDDGV